MFEYPYQHHKEAFRVLAQVFQSFDLPYFLIGGQARDLLLSRMNIPTYAYTKDIDFAVMVRDMGQFEQLRAKLLEVGFEPTKGAQYRLIWTSSHTIIDLLPFGSLADEGIVHFLPPGFDLSVRGFQEVLLALEYAEIDAEKKIRIPIAPLHGIFLLKIIAWSERPDDRGKDLDDMERILHFYWEFCEEEVYERHLDVFGLTEDIYDLKGCSARVLGRHLAQLLASSPVLRDEVADVLQREADKMDHPGKMLLKFARTDRDGEQDIGYAKRILDHLVAGLRDTFPQA
jgi:predicted nucleotidyltransferase